MEKQLHIEGMYCPNCEKRIEQILSGQAGIESARADYAAGTAVIECSREPDHDAIRQALRSQGYDLTDKPADLVRSVSLLVILLGLSVILERMGLLNRLVPQRLGKNGMSYALFFLTGLLTSVHCTAMCGGICLSQSLPGRGRWGSILYNAGRVVSYTLIGGVLGLIGSRLGGFTVSPLLQGCVKLLAGLFMLLAGVNLLGVFPTLRKWRPRLPGLRVSGKLPFVIGLLNGLMPCGPLQAMQLAALGTGDPLRGTLSMLFFSLGTVPLMLALGGIVSLLGRRYSRIVSAAGAVLVAVFGIAMLSQGAALSGMIRDWQLWALLLGMSALGLISLIPGKKRLRFVLSAAVLGCIVLSMCVRSMPKSDGPQSTARIENGVQVVSSTLAPGAYPDITVQAGVPVRWTIHADEADINGCNYKLIIRDLDLSMSFQPGDNLLEFTPKKPGTIQYSCWMGMIRGTITVTEQEDQNG